MCRLQSLQRNRGLGQFQRIPRLLLELDGFRKEKSMF